MKCFAMATLHLAALILLVTTALAGPHETGGIRGAVTTVGPDGAPVYLPGVEIVLRCEKTATGSISMLADETGRFSFRDLAPQKCSITAAQKGFHGETKSVEVIGNSETEVSFQLKLMTVEEQVMVSAEGPNPDTTETSSQREIRTKANKSKHLKAGNSNSWIGGRYGAGN